MLADAEQRMETGLRAAKHGVPFRRRVSQLQQSSQDLPQFPQQPADDLQEQCASPVGADNPMVLRLRRGGNVPLHGKGRQRQGGCQSTKRLQEDANRLQKH